MEDDMEVSDSESPEYESEYESDYEPDDSDTNMGDKEKEDPFKRLLTRMVILYRSTLHEKAPHFDIDDLSGGDGYWYTYTTEKGEEAEDFVAISEVEDDKGILSRAFRRFYVRITDAMKMSVLDNDKERSLKKYESYREMGEEGLFAMIMQLGKQTLEPSIDDTDEVYRKILLIMRIVLSTCIRVAEYDIRKDMNNMHTEFMLMFAPMRSELHQKLKHHQPLAINETHTVLRDACSYRRSVLKFNVDPVLLKRVAKLLISRDGVGKIVSGQTDSKLFTDYKSKTPFDSDDVGMYMYRVRNKIYRNGESAPMFFTKKSIE